MEKKDLKKFINENGFFLHVQSERLERDEIQYDENAIRTGVKAPTGESIMFFKGTATEEFKKGETNRNGYKIDVDAWDWKNYKKNPIVLLQHNSNEPIGKVMEILPHEKGVDVVYYVDKNALDEKNAARMEAGLIPMLSTGSLAHEVMFEHEKTGDRLPENEFFDLPWKEMKNYIRVITKAEAVEISAVTIGSNPNALTVKNALEIYFNNRHMDQEEKVNKEKKEAEEAAENAEETAEKSTESKETSEKEETKEEVKEESKEEKSEEETKEEEKKEDAVKEEDKVVISEEDKQKLVDTMATLQKALDNSITESEKEEAKEENKVEVSVEVNKTVMKLAEVAVQLANGLTEQNKSIAEIKAKLDKIPVRKALSVNSQFGEVEGKDGKEENKAEEKPKRKEGAALVDFIKGNSQVKV